MVQLLCLAKMNFNKQMAAGKKEKNRIAVVHKDLVKNKYSKIAEG